MQVVGDPVEGLAGAAPRAGSALGRGFKSGKAGTAGKARSSHRAERLRRLGTDMALRAWGARQLGSILLFALLTASAASLSWDLPEPRSRASKIRVHPRGNLWATGKSLGPGQVPLTTVLSTRFLSLAAPLSQTECLGGRGPWNSSDLVDGELETQTGQRGG